MLRSGVIDTEEMKFLYEMLATEVLSDTNDFSELCYWLNALPTAFQYWDSPTRVESFSRTVSILHKLVVDLAQVQAQSVWNGCENIILNRYRRLSSVVGSIVADHIAILAGITAAPFADQQYSTWADEENLQQALRTLGVINHIPGTTRTLLQADLDLLHNLQRLCGSLALIMPSHFFRNGYRRHSKLSCRAMQYFLLCMSIDGSSEGITINEHLALFTQRPETCLDGWLELNTILHHTQESVVPFDITSLVQSDSPVHSSGRCVHLLLDDQTHLSHHGSWSWFGIH